MNTRAAKYKEVCDRVVADPKFETILLAGEYVTFCNVALMVVCEEMGYGGFLGMLANQIYDKAKDTPSEWRVAPASDAVTAACSGILSFAAQRGKYHGHVAAVYPSALMVHSGKWKKECPQLANVGLKNGVLGANFCFGDEPTYFIKRERD